MRRQYRSSVLLLLALHIVYDSNAEQLDSGAKAPPLPSLSGFPPPELDGLAVGDTCRIVPIITPFMTTPVVPTPSPLTPSSTSSISLTPHSTPPTRAKVLPARPTNPINQLPAKKPTNQSPTRNQEPGVAKQPAARQPTTNSLLRLKSHLLYYLLINSGRPQAGYVPGLPANWLFPGYGVMSQNLHPYQRKTALSRNKGQPRPCCRGNSDSDSDSSEES
ncbi:unnamed protein product [Gadus morhua 'NCC']